ncbi:hypothetical protein GCM10010400_57980 [Streptomyces aculeolatus]|uniref:hypothetical protein n=1 Tax=Streptomyces aculeolatus TaxID=270689 RepID=UPI001CEC71FC|nr:hypothetical protein [Streptomyces aculeolatus]
MTDNGLQAHARSLLWQAWTESAEEIASAAVEVLAGRGMLVEEGGAAELEKLRAQRRFLLEQVRRKDAASGEGNRALADFLAEHDAQTDGADFPLRGGHDNPCAYAAGIGPTCTCSKRDGGEAEAPRTERSRWQAIADALNAVDAIGIDLDGTLTDHRTWSVVWDRAAERWVVAGYDDDTAADEGDVALGSDAPQAGHEYGVRYGDAIEHVDQRRDRADAEQALTRWRDMRSDAVLVQRTVRYGPWRTVKGDAQTGGA